MGIKNIFTTKKIAGANKELEAILGNETSRKALLEIANTNEKMDAILNKLFTEFDKAKDSKAREKIKKEIENTTQNGPKTKAEIMLNKAFEAFLSGDAQKKADVAIEYLGEDVSNPELLLNNANDVLGALNNHQKIDNTLVMKAATVLVYGQLYGMGGVISKKECKDHTEVLEEFNQAQAFLNTVFKSKKRTK